MQATYQPDDYNHRFDKYLEEYYDTDGINQTKLQVLSDKVLASLSGVPYKDYMDYYSIANTVFWNIIKSDVFDESQCSFNTYLRSCLTKKFRTEYKRRMRTHKEKANTNAESLDAPLKEDKNYTLRDTLIAEGVIEDEIKDFLVNDGIRNFFSGLSRIQKEIVMLKTEGFTIDEIKGKIGISDYQYEINWNQIMSYENLKHLFKY